MKEVKMCLSEDENFVFCEFLYFLERGREFCYEVVFRY